jgi:glycosyltransferase involved in cell wall biosynthesis
METTNSPSRVLQVLTRKNVGGPARLVQQLEKGLSPEFCVETLAGSVAPGEFELTGPSEGARALPMSRAIAPLGDLRAFVALHRAMFSSEKRVDLVHTHMAKAGSLARLAVAGHRLREGRPLVVHTFHGHVLHGYFSKGVSSALVMAERALAHMSDALVAVSPEIRDELLEMGIGKESQWHVIIPGIELGPFLRIPPADQEAHNSFRVRFGIAPGSPVVGIIGRLAPVKDHENLFKAMVAVGRQLPEAHLVVVGGGELDGSLKALAHSLGIAERVRFTGWVQDVPGALAAMDLVVCSSWAEGTPLSLIEAQAAARPVVSTQVGGVTSVVVDGVTGLLVPAKDPTSLGQAIVKVLGDRSLARKLGQQGRTHACKQFSSERFLSQTAQLYRELLARSPERWRNQG